MHLQNTTHIRRYLTTDATFVTSTLDYGNALLAGLPRDQNHHANTSPCPRNTGPERLTMVSQHANAESRTTLHAY